MSASDGNGGSARSATVNVQTVLPMPQASTAHAHRDPGHAIARDHGRRAAGTRRPTRARGCCRPPTSMTSRSASLTRERVLDRDDREERGQREQRRLGAPARRRAAGSAKLACSRDRRSRRGAKPPFGGCEPRPLAAGRQAIGLSIATPASTTPSGSVTSSSSSGSEAERAVERHARQRRDERELPEALAPARRPRTPRGSAARGRAASSRRGRTSPARAPARSPGRAARPSPAASPLPV